MAITSQSSVLSSAANKIVSANIRSTSSFVSAKKEYKKFGDFLFVRTLELERSAFPDPNEIKKLSTISISKSFGSAGGLLGSLLSGALDLGGFIRGFFPGKDKKIGQASSARATKPKPKLKGSRLRLSGGRALPIVSTLFAGLDFATGLAEGESIGKSAAGTAGSLAGSLLGGAIGQTLIPVPGLGFVIGSAVGGFLGGWTADRAYDAESSMLNKPKVRQEQKLEEGRKKEEPKVKEDSSLVMRQNSLLSNFDTAVDKFDELVSDFINGKVSIFSSEQVDQNYEPIEPPPITGTGEEYTGPISGDTFLPLPGATSIGDPKQGQNYDANRGNRKHKGIDLTQIGPQDSRAPIIAYKTGKVIKVETGDIYPGGSIEIDHGNGLVSRYLHITPNVKENQIVYGGQKIGNLFKYYRNGVEQTHLHFEIYQNGKIKNPTPFVTGAKNKLTAPLSDVNARLQHEKNAGVQNTPSSTKGIFNLEIHSPGPNERQRSGLIRSTIDTESGMSRSLMGRFGSYEMGFRDLGGPKRGLNLIETDMLRGVEYNAERIISAIKENPDIQVNIFAGHNDLRKGEGETGTEGEMEYNRKVAERVEQLARERGLGNIQYIRSSYAREGSNPNSNWSKAKKLREEYIKRLSQVSAAPPQLTPQNIEYILPYNRENVMTNNQIIAMVPQQTSTPKRGTSTPFSMGSSPSLMISNGGDEKRNTFNDILELKLNIG